MLNSMKLHPRLFIAVGLGLGAGLLLPRSWGALVRAIIVWNLVATIHLALVWFMMSRATTQSMRVRAELQDESGWTLLAVSAGAAVFSLCASLGLISNFKDLSSTLRPVYLGLAIYTIVVSWFFLHTLFALHYAAEYYAPVPRQGHARKDGVRGGLQFPNDDIPGYLEFAYFSFTIGMTAQTSDTAVTTTTMRAFTMAHSILTFFFNTVVLALSINIAASAI